MSCHTQQQVHLPTSTATKVSMTAVTHGIINNTLMQLLTEGAIRDEDVIGKHMSRGPDGATHPFEWALHSLTVCVGYKTPIFSSANEKLFDVFKQLLKTFLLTKKRGGTPAQRRASISFLKKECMMSCTTMAVQV
jgi:hypothetical protein